MGQPSMSDRDSKYPLLAEGGMPYRVIPQGDPLEAFFDLMEVVEMLCPQWPPREPLRGTVFRL